MKIYALARDKKLYDAKAEYEEGIVVVKKGSKINNINREKFKPSDKIMKLRTDNSLVDEIGILQEDVMFKSLSAAATFVTGRIANGVILWKNEQHQSIKKLIEKDTQK